ncbi:MAG: hypothetical protein V1822_04480 [Candidatus Micrarchaeota archaeon]
MTYTGKYAKSSQLMIWAVQKMVEDQLEPALEEYGSGMLGRRVEKVVGSYSGKDGAEAEKCPNDLCEKVASLLICEQEAPFKWARGAILALAGIYPQKMMEEMDKIGFFLHGPEMTDRYVMLEAGSQFFRKDFECIPAVNKLIFEAFGAKKEKHEKDERKSLESLDSEIKSAIGIFLANAFEELWEWNLKNPRNRIEFNGKFFTSISIVDASAGEMDIGPGAKNCGKFKDYHTMIKNGGVREKYNGFLAHVIEKCVSDNELARQMLNAFKIPIGERFEQVCADYIEGRRSNEKLTMDRFATVRDNKIGKERAWRYSPVIVGLRAEFDDIDMIEKREKEAKKGTDWAKASNWLEYSILRHVRDPFLKESMLATLKKPTVNIEIGGIAERKPVVHKNEKSPGKKGHRPRALQTA